MTKYKWTKKDNENVTRGYIDNKNHIIIQQENPHIPVNSIKMKCQNCLYLHKGAVKGALKNYSKVHYIVWNAIMNERQ